ncbi:RNA-directed DNA polymerase, eukaryota, reverse transcriptase zinc-binding domain protein [Tanacetum coccineum]
MEAIKELKNEIEIQYVDKSKNVKGSKKVPVMYDWKPPACSHCKVFGYDIKKCKNGGAGFHDKGEIHNTEKPHKNIVGPSNVQQERNNDFVTHGRKRVNRTGNNFNVQNQNQVNGPWKMDKRKQYETENQWKNKEGNMVRNNKWKVKDKVVEELRNTANKFSILNTLPEDNEQEISILKGRMIVDKFLNEKVQPTLKEYVTWTGDMEDVLEINNGTTKVMADNVIDDMQDVSNMQECNKGNYKFKSFYTFVYAANEGSERKSLWEELVKEKRYVNGKPWCIAGDMNVTLMPNEHSCGSSVMTSDMVDFQECLNKIEVEDICRTGLHFTWTKNLHKNKAGIMTGILKNLDRKLKSLKSPLNNLGWSKGNLFKRVKSLRGQLQKDIEDCATLFHKRISEDEALKMIIEVPDKEIKNVMFDIGDSKALGPDGFTTAFFKKAWGIIGADVCNAIREFFISGKMLGEINATLISLTPKEQTPSRVTNFRPIAYCNVIYKCISKIITNRIKPVLGSLVSNNQSAFIPGRQVHDNILLTQEIMKDYNRKRGPKRVAFKIYLQKAYDTVSWKFLKKNLEEFRFHKKMVNWIMQCVTTARFTLNVNGERIGYFKGRRGLKQGDLVSPYLFTLIMEVFSLMLNRQIENHPKFQYHFGCKTMKLIHVCFADDLLVMCHGDSDFVNLCEEDRHAILNVLLFAIGKLPVRYLGVPLIAKRLSVKECLIAGVLESIHVYWASVFLLPITVINEINKLLKGFLWNQGDIAKGKAKVAWINLCRPRDQRNGNDTSLWFDNWSDMGYLFKTLSYRDLYDARLKEDLNLRDMIANGQ